LLPVREAGKTQKGRLVRDALSFLRRSAKNELRAQLHQPGIGAEANAGDSAEITGRDVTNRVSKVDVVKDIEGIQPHLERCAFGDARVFLDREVAFQNDGPWKKLRPALQVCRGIVCE